jgi:two-component system chemotaxis response regulator CheB
LFRSAARMYGSRVIGVVLSGALDDGTAGMLAVKRCGGIAIVQNPSEALFPGMPRSALEYAEVDYCLPLDEIGPTLARLTREPIPLSAAQSGRAADDAPDFDTRMAALEADAMDDDTRPGQPSPFGCPECGGVLWERADDTLARYRCRVGHAYSPETLLAAQTEAHEAALWSALRALEEKAQLTRRLVDRAESQLLHGAATRFRAVVADAEEHIAVVGSMLREGVGDTAERDTEPARSNATPDA